MDAYTILTRLDFLIILVYKLKAVNGRRLSLQALVVPGAVEVKNSIFNRKLTVIFQQGITAVNSKYLVRF